MTWIPQAVDCTGFEVRVLAPFDDDAPARSGRSTPR
jgi:hypothetical protein